MVKYNCSRCSKGFSQKSHYDSHKRRKTPCEDNTQKLKTLIYEIINEKIRQLIDKPVLDETNEKLKNLIYELIDERINQYKKNEPIVLKEDNSEIHSESESELIQTSMSLEYSKLSLSLTKKIEKKDKKKDGIYFTPPKTIEKNIQLLEPYMSNIKNILEPSCGSCEYIFRILNKYNNKHIVGYELNPTIFESIKTYQNDTIKLYNTNFLECDNSNTYDLIIGNPPYFVMKKKQVDKRYHDYFEGRPNIFILFIIKSLKLLNNNGILSFVLPKNFLNCLYYDKTRQFINTHFQILNIIECTKDFIETQQETVIFIIQKSNTIDNTKYKLCINNFIIFGIPENIIKLKSFYNDSSVLSNLGFNVSVGNVVWNQCKEELTLDESKTLLIYSSDIKNNKLEIQQYANKDKKNYIDKKGSNETLLVINRGYGMGNYTFNYCLLNTEKEYLIENHLICIRFTKSITKEELISKYKKLTESFQDKKTKEFVELYFGNNAINTTELCNILPIYGF